MLLRSIVALALLALPLCSCTAPQSNSVAVNEMDRRHDDLMKTMPGGGGSGGSGM